MFKCIKDVTLPHIEGAMFQEGATYYTHHFSEFSGYHTTNEAGEPHIVGRAGEEFFDEHFRELTDEEYVQFMIEAYKDMPNHDEIEIKALQESIKNQIEKEVAPYEAFYVYFKELYGQGLQVANWHQNGELEPFDSFFEEAEHEMKKEM